MWWYEGKHRYSSRFELEMELCKSLSIILEPQKNVRRATSFSQTKVLINNLGKFEETCLTFLFTIIWLKIVSLLTVQWLLAEQEEVERRGPLPIRHHPSSKQVNSVMGNMPPVLSCFALLSLLYDLSALLEWYLNPISWNWSIVENSKN